MKNEFSKKPAKMKDKWPGELSMFSWEEFIATIPNLYGYKL